MSMTEADRLKRQQNAAAYNSLSQADKMSRIQSVTGKASNPQANAIQSLRSEVSPTAGSSATNQTLNTIQGNVRPFEFKAPEEFSYNQYADPAYQSALASARANISQQQLDTNAQLRASGQGKSSYSEQVANQIGTKEMGRVATDVLPQLISQAYQRYNDTANRDLQVQQANYGIHRDQVGDAFNKATLTGNYTDPRAESYANAITELGKAWSNPNATPEQKSAYHQQAEEYRAALRGMGIDSNLFGADVSTEGRLANMNRLGVQTMDSVNQQASLTGMLPDGTPTTAEQQRQLQNEWLAADQTGVITPTLAQLYGLNPGTSTQQAKQFAQQLAISKQNANTSAFSAETSRKNLEYSMDEDNPDNIYKQLQIEGLRNPSVQPLTAESLYDQIDKSTFLSPETVTGLDGSLQNTGKTIVNDPVGLERYILSQGLPDEEARKLYYRYGLKWGG